MIFTFIYIFMVNLITAVERHTDIGTCRSKEVDLPVKCRALHRNALTSNVYEQMSTVKWLKS